MGPLKDETKLKVDDNNNKTEKVVKPFKSKNAEIS